MNQEELQKSRHSLAHLLAAAVLELYPDALPTLGPAIDTGFYYDFDFNADRTQTTRRQNADKVVVSEKDFAKIENKMRAIAKTWQGFEKKELSADEARKLFAGNPYKLELIEEIIAKSEPITTYTSGTFTDLCRGGHVSDMSRTILDMGWKLDRVAGAYWRGDEKNKMLTRIYGFTFESKDALEAYEKQIEEAEKRDHKKLGKELGLFVFSELVGSGLPLWTPKGTIMRELLNDYVWELRKVKGYSKVTIPHITKKDLYETSGHWSKFADELFKINTREGHLFAMKPMNCPHHTQIFDSTPHSYKEMPQRYAETTMVYRDEQSGELSGLSRVRAITQDDAHVFCRETQIEAEMFAVWDIIDTFYTTFGFELSVRFSRHDPDHFEKYIGDEATWKKAEDQIKAIIKKRGVENYIDGKGEAAMYGPKIDFLAKDSLGRILQVATIQLDFNMPNRFNLYCINEKGEKEPVVMIHCAIMGSIERFMSTIIEHYAGNFPLWLSPVQVKVIPVRDTHNAYAKKITDALKEAGVRVVLDDDDENLGKKVRKSKNEKIPYWLVIGDKEVEAGTVTLESRDKGQIGALGLEDLISQFTSEIREKK